MPADVIKLYDCNNLFISCQCCKKRNKIGFQILKFDDFSKFSQLTGSCTPNHWCVISAQTTEHSNIATTQHTNYNKCNNQWNFFTDIYMLSRLSTRYMLNMSTMQSNYHSNNQIQWTISIHHYVCGSPLCEASSLQTDQFCAVSLASSSPMSKADRSGYLWHSWDT